MISIMNVAPDRITRPPRNYTMLQVDEAQAEHGDPAAPPIISKLFSIPMDVLLAAVPKVEEFLASSTLARGPA